MECAERAFLGGNPPVGVAMQRLVSQFTWIWLVAGCCALASCHAHRSGLRACSLFHSGATADDPLTLASAEFARGQRLEASGDEACVDAYFQASRLAWDCSDAAATYNAAVERLLLAAQHFGRLDPACGLTVNCGSERMVIPVTQHGFAWSAGDFQRLHAPPQGRESLLSRRYSCSGLGAPLVVERCQNSECPIERRFFPPRSFFAATAVVRFDAEGPLVEFRNPFAPPGESSPKLAADYSSGLAKTLEIAPRTYLAGFVEPGSAADAARLGFFEPYQSGKIPVVLIHGLFSDPLSWADLVNDLRATPGFADRYQIWLFRYPTGQGFLRSAATLRRDLADAVQMLDPECRDQSLRQMVLVGHSMGGLVAKLQVTYSDELIWSELANRPLEEIVASDEARKLLIETCYFDPAPHVARVIFIATPHQGSLRSSGLVGRGAALLVEPSAEQSAIHDQLVRDNPGAFNPLFENRLPTSIDMLEPRSPLLAAMRQMRIGPGVRLHNIVGVSHPTSLDGPSDGVVSVRSASHPGCQSVLAIGAKHASVHRARATSDEVLRILGVW
jgi:pimeloyl-ACP methyl ester carboxylesterase